MEKIKNLAKILGPGLITGASDDDPSGIATYSQTGAQFGFSQLWLTLFSTPFMIVIQEMCGRIGFVTGRGLAGVLKKYYPKKLVYSAVIILLVANLINIGADLGAMAESIQMIIHFPYVVWLLVIALLCVLLEIIIPYKSYVKYLKYLSITFLAYIVTAFIIKPDWSQVLHSTIIPTMKFNQEYFLNIVALLGTTISPYLFFWQSNEEVEEKIEMGREQSLGRKVGYTTKKDVWRLDTDTTVGMIFSNVIAFFIILTCAATLGTHGIQTINTAAQAASALKPIAGDFAFLLFTTGIIGGGLLAVPVLAGSVSYAVCETFGWKASLIKTPLNAKIFYSIIALATLIGVIVNFSPIPPFKLLYYSAALNGILAPPLMLLIILISGNEKIMGGHKSSLLSTFLGGVITVIMMIGAIALIFSSVIHSQH